MVPAANKTSMRCNGYIQQLKIPDSGSKPDTVDNGQDYREYNQPRSFPANSSFCHVVRCPQDTQVGRDNCERCENNKAHSVPN